MHRRTSRGILMMPIAVGLAVIAVGVGPVRGQVQATDRPLTAADSADLAEGKRVYGAQCALCHGVDGSGGYGPSLLRPTFVRAADDEGLLDILRSGIPGLMPGFGSANGERRTWQIAAFVRTLNSAGGERATGNAAAGQAIYDRRGCATCHVVAGAGRALGPDLSSIGQQRGLAYLREALVSPAARVPEGHVVLTARPKSGPAVRGVRASEDAFWVHIRDTSGRLHAFRTADLAELEREAGASLMPAYGAQLTPAELNDLVAFLASLRGQR
ncbi:MAG TPA: c-type cytochrome [Vicinamibacterales bacterium]|nr:c-type cytochrome [Vicinamibacterales bacterium]